MFYQLKKEQYLPVKKESLWDFVSSPKNLKRITPTYMGFDIITPDVPEEMYNGVHIGYIVKPLWGVKMKWLSELKHIRKNEYFVDEQRVGPYRYWFHEHILEDNGEGCLMTDRISYALPRLPFSTIINKWIVRRKLEEIFEYREKVFAENFS